MARGEAYVRGQERRAGNAAEDMRGLLVCLYVGVFLLVAACAATEQSAGVERQVVTKPAPPGPPKQDELDALQRSLEDMDRLGQTRLSNGEIDALRRQIANCWMLPVGMEGIEDMVVQLRVQTQPDGVVQHVVIMDQIRLDQDPKFRAVAQSALRAVERCSPLQLPPDKYAAWRELEKKFYPGT
jgi:hypothetical protein